MARTNYFLENKIRGISADSLKHRGRKPWQGPWPWRARWVGGAVASRDQAAAGAASTRINPDPNHVLACIYMAMRTQDKVKTTDSRPCSSTKAGKSRNTTIPS